MSSFNHTQSFPTGNTRTPEQRQLLVLGGSDWTEGAVREPLEGRAERVVPALSLDEAMNFLREQPVDIVLLQAASPRCARWVEAIRAEFDTPVLAIGESDAVDAALVAGATDFIVEPCSRQVLIRRLDLVLETANVPCSADNAIADLITALPLTPAGATSSATDTAHWELDAANGELVWSPSIARVLDPETAAQCCTLIGLLGVVEEEDRHQLQRELQQLADGEKIEMRRRIELQGVTGKRYKLELKGEALADEFIFGTLSATDPASEPAFEYSLEPQTGLPAQTLLVDKLSAMMNRLVAGVTAAMVIDLSGLSRIGAHFGPEVGVSLQLAAVARLREHVPPESAIAVLADGRLGVALENMASTNVVHKLATKIKRRLAENYYYGDQPLHVQPVIGIAVSSSDANEASELVSCAVLALEQGGVGEPVKFYADQTRMKQQNNKLEISIEAYLYNALDNGEFELHYQPQVDTAKQKIIGMEALLRWTNPQLGRVAPSLFIPIAERAGLIGPIGEWVMHESARQMAEWRALGLKPVRVSVNLSPRQLENDNVEKQLLMVSRQFDIPPSQFDLEVTETVSIAETLQLRERLARMRALGATVSLDDFGTQHSALSHLQDLDIDCLKIDRQFVEKIDGDGDAMIAGLIVAMAHTLDKHVIAEGVETLEQLRYLQERGCNAIQGFYFCKPVDADTATQLLRDGYEGLLARNDAVPLTAAADLSGSAQFADAWAS